MFGMLFAFRITTETNLNDHKIKVIKMLRILIVILVSMPGLVFGQEWKLQTSGTSAALRDVCFVDDMNGWVVGDSGTILHTSNGGITWILQTIGITDKLNAVVFVDTLTGWIVGRNGMLFHTSSGGKIWTRQDSKTILPLNDVFFINQTTGWAAGGMQTSDQGVMGIIIGTTDGGNSWNELVDPKRGGYVGTFFLNEREGWVVGGKRLLDNFDEDIILHTTDEGINWEEQHTPTIGPLHKIFFLNKNVGWATGDSPLAEGALRTKDGGLNWHTIKLQQDPIVTSELLRGLAIVDSNNIWISSLDAIYHSKDGGQGWKKEIRESQNLISTIFFIDIRDGWAVGQAGSIWRYSGEYVSVPETKLESYRTFLDFSFPNPTNRRTQINYSVKREAHVVLKIFDSLGREVMTLVDRKQPPGLYTVPFDGERFPSGVYYYQLIIDQRVETKKMLLLR